MDNNTKKPGQNQASDNDSLLRDVTESDYKYGFVTDIDTDIIPVGLSEDVVRLISEKKGGDRNGCSISG